MEPTKKSDGPKEEPQEYNKAEQVDPRQDYGTKELLEKSDPFNGESRKYYQALMQDIFTMISHARESGIDLPESLRTEIAELIQSETNIDRNPNQKAINLNSEV